jgi:hypothetical protein
MDMSHAALTALILRTRLILPQNLQQPAARDMKTIRNLLAGKVFSVTFAARFIRSIARRNQLNITLGRFNTSTA